MKQLTYLSFVLGVTLVLPACGGSDSNPDATLPDSRLPTLLDAAVDADLRDSPSAPLDDAGLLVFGPGLVLNQVRFADAGHSWAGWAPLVNPQFDMAIDDGDMILLLELRGLDDPGGQNDPDGVSVAIYSGVDTDYDPDNNFSGSASLRVAAASVDSLGFPRAMLPDATLVDGHLSGSVVGEILLFLPAIGAVKVQDADFSADLVADGSNEAVVQIHNGVLSGNLLARHLEEVPNPVSSTCLAHSMLDLVALPCLSFDGVQPDVDRDDDGLESFDEDKYDLDGQIDICTDGDATTYVSTATVQCVLDPAFQDAYTAIIEVGGVRAFLLPPQL
jgi:hypothetical protein